MRIENLEARLVVKEYEHNARLMAQEAHMKQEIEQKDRLESKLLEQKIEHDRSVAKVSAEIQKQLEDECAKTERLSAELAELKAQQAGPLDGAPDARTDETRSTASDRSVVFIGDSDSEPPASDTDDWFFADNARIH